MSVLTIAAGGAAGPEAPLVTTCGTLAGWFARKRSLTVDEGRCVTIAGMAAAFTVLFGAPLGSAIFALEILHRRGMQYTEALLPAIVGSLMGFVCYVTITGADLVPAWHIPGVARLHAADLLWAAAAGVAGALIAVVFTYLTLGLRWILRAVPAAARPVIGGLGLASLALCSPYALTFGEVQTGHVLATRIGVGVLALACRGQARGHLAHRLLGLAGRIHHPAVLRRRDGRPADPSRVRGRTGRRDLRRAHGRGQRRRHQDDAGIDADRHRDGRLAPPSDHADRGDARVYPDERGRVDPLSASASSAATAAPGWNRLATFKRRRTGGTTLGRRLGLTGVTLLVGALAACSSSARKSAPAASSSTAAPTPTTAATARCVPPNAGGPVAATRVTGITSDWTLSSFDATLIRMHWFRALGASAAQPAPTVLMGPGWGQAGDTNTSGVGLFGSLGIGELQKAGYNVLTWDPRGFGQSTGTVETDSADFEGRDVEKMLDWVSTQSGVLLDGPRDPRVGMVGGSYGGGIQLVAAAIDCRVDAIADDRVALADDEPLQGATRRRTVGRDCSPR